MLDHSGELEAVNRLYELARDGETDSSEYTRLDQQVFSALVQTYGAEEGIVRQTAVAA
ncbi:hypothetical protein QFW77_09595 [Luteimonas sp. RD2P54]|uniref:Uncharacterized protein n=1 Tax=Luteimonas endophytica TaxID=3042023 RepID=A0ABT6JAN8_9GAMM|nr:hypothetical protein [Luteimonas endophytica]MDH5823238.1 hypothetical protein [Luteimonas endophytica]